MSKYAVIGLVLIAVAVVVYNGCDGVSDRVGVAKDKAIAEIDKLLGEINVQQKAVQRKYDEIESMMATVREKHIEAQIRVKRMQEKMDELTATKAKHKANLAKLQGYLKQAQESEAKSADVNGKQVSVDELKAMAERTIGEYKAAKNSLSQIKPIADAWAKNFQVLSKQRGIGDDQLKKLNGQLDQIAAKKAALDGMREAATIAGPAESISDKFNELTSEVEELMIDIDTKFEIEEMKLDERAAKLASEVPVDIDELLGNKSDASGTISEIDSLLKDD